MAEQATIARPYARAAFEYAREHRVLAAWSQLLEAGARVASAPGAGEVFGNPRVASHELVELIAGIAHEAGTEVSAEQRNFLGVLAHNRRLGQLAEIAAQYAMLKAEAEHTLEVEVATAMALEPSQRAALAQALKTRFAREVRLVETLTPELIGGAVVRAGDLVIDGSLASRLKRLEQQISRA